MKETVQKWLIGAALAALVSLAGLFLHFQIKAQVAEQMADAGIPPKETITAMQKDIDANRVRGLDNKERGDKLENKIERVVGILLED